MDPFRTLLKQAADKRDAIIAAARNEFSEAKKRIKALRIELGAKASPDLPGLKFRRVADVALEVMPRDKTFMLGELIELLAKAEPGRRFTQGTVRMSCQRLMTQGVIRRVSRINGRTLWAHADFKGKVDMTGVVRLPDLAAEILSVCGPMRSSDLLARIRERGFRASDNPRRLLQALRTALNRCTIFERDKTGKWRLSK